MKTIILAAGRGTRLGDLTKEKPKCLLRIGDKTILETTTGILRQYGLDDITIVVGEKGECWTPQTYAQLRDLVPDMVVNDKNDRTHSGYSCALAMKDMEPQNILVVDGDLIFRPEAIETILTSPSTSLLTRPTTSPTEPGGKVKGHGGRVTYCGITPPEALPWDIYSGLMKIGKGIYSDLIKTWLQHEDQEILFGLNFLCRDHMVHMRRIGYYFSEEGGGGSDLQVLTVVRKQSSTERRIKLSAEVKFLQDLPERWRKHFPEVLSSSISPERTYYEMPKYEFPSLRRLILSGAIDHTRALSWIDRILEFQFGEMYVAEQEPTPKTYMDFMHIQRVWKRLQETFDKSTVFQDIIPREELVINGKRYKNMPIALSLLEGHSDLLGRCLPSSVTRWGHFDLHFANILIDLKNDNFVLVDPRAYSRCDYYYDLGKVWHSAHGLYDLISERMFDISGENGTYQYKFADRHALEEYERIAAGLPEMFSRHTKEPLEDTMMKVAFNEMMHFCSFMPFFFDYDQFEHRALCAYLRGVELINAFEKEYLPKYSKVEWININYPKDWKAAGEQEWRLI